VTGQRGTEVARTVFPYPPIPHGWKTYRSMGIPFAIAYPSGWSVDPSNSPVGMISFLSNSKTGAIGGAIVTRSLPQPKVGLDVLRGRYLSATTAVCEAGIRVGNSGRARFSRVTFATETATCAGEEAGESTEPMAFYLGVAIKDGAEWMFSFHCHGDELATNERRYFIPMLRTLHIYKLS
jgi:hypothetical protein